MNELAVSIGHLIRTTREFLKISQESLALQCGMDRSYLGRIEQGELNITVSKLYLIANNLNVNAKDLLP